MLLNWDIERYVVPAAHRIFGPASWQLFGEVRRAALGSMIYQLGERGVSRFTRLLSCVSRSDWSGAAQSALDSKWARQTPVRAKRHADALKTGRDVWRRYA